jgi:RHH-type proline utilization regulon transcriptional repressor/proline dehydrogenase/delta 1-pyrroline-5-carboxylate dehydrogenase
MGEPLFEQILAPAAQGGLGLHCRIYAPVGRHRTLLAYLVRRLLENGANTSFVHRVADSTVSSEELVRDPLEATLAHGCRPHPLIPDPPRLYGAQRPNSRGLDLDDETTLLGLSHQLLGAAQRPGPAVADATADEIEEALDAATRARHLWSSTPPATRAAMLEDAADGLEADMPQMLSLLMHEAGKSCADAVGELREAVDFLRYYAAQIRDGFDNATHRPLGVVVCISPWNFPLSILITQIAGALAAGNTVLSKPAEQTPRIAAAAIRILRAAGVPPGALHLLPGRGEIVGARLVSDARVHGVLFTGSLEVARGIQATLAARGPDIPCIAETSGLNAMIVDSSALPEQVVADVVSSAFDSAGQRCSALRLLCLQDDVADRVLDMLRGAMALLVVGDPRRLETDVGPIIDAEAHGRIVTYIEAMRAAGRPVFQARPAPPGSFVAPSLIELDQVKDLTQEVFGPVLHAVRFPVGGVDAVVDQINALGYGLTMGLHTRLDGVVARVANRAHVGNLYVNRNIIGAVVGTQPFGGEGKSGTGPKAGGPLYLLRLLSSYPSDAVAHALRRLARAPEWLQPPGVQSMDAGKDCQGAYLLPGITGETNIYTLRLRENADPALPLARRLLERCISINTTATGGNAALAAMDD